MCVVKIELTCSIRCVFNYPYSAAFSIESPIPGNMTELSSFVLSNFCNFRPNPEFFCINVSVKITYCMYSSAFWQHISEPSVEKRRRYISRRSHMYTGLMENSWQWNKKKSINVRSAKSRSFMKYVATTIINVLFLLFVRIRNPPHVQSTLVDFP